MAEIIALPQTEYILRCSNCGSNSFYIYLGGRNPYNIEGYECTECEERWDLLPLEECEDG